MNEVSKRREDSPEVRVLLRLFLGFFGGVFVSLFSYVMCWYSFDPRLPTEGPAVLAASIGFFVGGIAIALCAFSTNPVLRLIAWTLGGLGFGNVLLAVIRGGLTVGTYVTDSGLVMALSFAVIGYRTVPPSRNTD